MRVGISDMQMTSSVIVPTLSLFILSMSNNCITNLHIGNIVAIDFIVMGYKLPGFMYGKTPHTDDDKILSSVRFMIKLMTDN